MSGPQPQIQPQPEGPTKVVGTKVRRIDAVDKAAGSTRFGSDTARPPGLLHAKVLTSTEAHAQIVGIDTSKAEALKGVRAIVTEADFTSEMFGVLLNDQPPLARGKVRFYGEPVAAVAADTEEIAEEALELIKVTYKPLKTFLDRETALEGAGEPIHGSKAGYKTLGPPNQHEGNLLDVIRVENGDVDKAFQQAHRIYENEYRTPISHHGYIEPHVASAEIDASGKVTVRVPTQSAFTTRDNVARSIGLPPSKVRVIGTYIGGGFGGKLDLLLEHVVAKMAMITGRPVKGVASREMDFLSTFTRAECSITIKTAVDKDGNMTARQARIILGAGAFSGLAPAEMGSIVSGVTGPYNIPNIKIDAQCVYTNKQNSQMVRGPGLPQAAFAGETQIDLIASDFAVDSIEYRRRHALKSGDTSFSGIELHHVVLDEILVAVKEKHGWDSKKDKSGNGKLRGRGIAVAEWHSGMMGSGAVVKLNADGTATVLSGTSELGGGEATAVALLAAEELGLEVEDISVQIADTDVVPYDAGVFGSRATHSMGLAIQKGARDVRNRVLTMAAGLLEANPDDLTLENKMVFVKGSPEKGMPLAQIAGMANFTSGPIIGVGSNSTPMAVCDPTVVKEGSIAGSFAHTYAAQIVDVEVDPESGQVTVLSLVAANDVGKSINPAGVEGQIEGGAVMGIGFALTEQMHHDDQGRLLNPNLLDYKMPTALDVPAVDPIPVEIFDPYGGPHGAKGVGEPPIMPTAPAIANAIFDATGVMIHELPLTPERVRRALKANTAAGG